jgi:cephalosporin hydroxylase
MSDQKDWKKEKQRLFLIVLIVYLLGAGIQYYYFCSESAVIKAFHKLTVEKYAETTWRSTKWLGIRSLVNPFDAWIFQEIISDVKPDVIIETGTFEGGGSLYLATILAQLNPDGKIITIDIEDQQQGAAKIPVYQKHVTFLLGSSTDEAVVEKIKNEIQDKKVLVRVPPA